MCSQKDEGACPAGTTDSEGVCVAERQVGTCPDGTVESENGQLCQIDKPRGDCPPGSNPPTSNSRVCQFRIEPGETCPEGRPSPGSDNCVIDKPEGTCPDGYDESPIGNRCQIDKPEGSCPEGTSDGGVPGAACHCRKARRCMSCRYY